jgi:hypothetical protein
MNKNTIVLLVVALLVLVFGSFFFLTSSPEPTEEEISEFTVSSGDKFKICVGQTAKEAPYAVKFLSAGEKPMFDFTVFDNTTTLSFQPGKAHGAMLLEISVSEDPDGEEDCVLMTWTSEHEEVEVGEFSIGMADLVQVKGTDVKLTVFGHPDGGNVLQAIGSEGFVQKTIAPGDKTVVDGLVIEYLGFIVGVDSDTINAAQGVHKFNVYEEE